MADEVLPLTDDERAELEALRAEKAAREEQARAARERAELEALRAEREQAQAERRSASARPSSSPAPARPSQAELDQDRRIREQRERGARLMEPDDDLRMPLGQKIVLAVIGAAVAIVAIIMLFVH